MKANSVRAKNMPKRVLVFSHIDNVRSHIKHAIREIMSSELIEANHQQDAIKTIKAMKIDILFFDWDKYNGNKLQMLDMINESSLNPDWKVVVVSSNFDKADVQSAIKGGANDFVLKPFSADTIQRKVKRYINNASIS